jgi:ribulose-5-phosphate 4-epimerase/fuculose-1-phosphate aldolase
VRAGERKLRGEIIAACKILAREGLVRGFGHVSARLPGTSRFLLTPRVSLELVRAGDLLAMSLDGKVASGRKAPPFEAPLHAAIYRARPDVGAIARIHGRKANRFGASRTPLVPVHNHGSFFGGGVPVFSQPDLVSTAELGEAVARSLGGHRAILLRGNGQVVVGASVAEAVMMAIYLEETADIYHGALQLGEPIPLSAEECRSRMAEALPPVDLERAWNFYRRRARSRAGR